MKKILLLLLAAAGGLSQIACVPVAAGLAGAAVGHEVAEERDEDDGDRD